MFLKVHSLGRAICKSTFRAALACNARNFMHLRGSSSLDALNLEARWPRACTWLIHKDVRVRDGYTYRVHREDSISVDPQIVPRPDVTANTLSALLAIRVSPYLD